MIPRPSSLHSDPHRAPSSASAGGAATPTSFGHAHQQQQSLPKRCLGVCKSGLIGGLERFFFHYGKLVSLRPGLFICLSLAVCLVCSYGLTMLTKEENGTRLWIAEDSTSRLNYDWLWSHYPPSGRYASMIFEADNVLTPEVLQTMFRVRNEIAQIKTEEFGDTWKDHCIQLPVVRPPDLTDIFGRRRRRRRRRRKRQSGGDDDDDFGDFDFGDDFFTDETFFEEALDEAETAEQTPLSLAELYSAEGYPEPYCPIVEGMDTACLEMSILELWANNGEYDAKTQRDVDNLSRKDILDRVNSVNTSGVFLVQRDFTKLLSKIEYNSTGHIVGARAMTIQWLSQMNATAALLNPTAQRMEPIEQSTFAFEGSMIAVMRNKSGYPSGLDTYPQVKRSFGDIAGSTILGDISSLLIGYMIVFVFVMIMLGQFNSVEQRAYLSLAGILGGVVMGIVVSYGVCSFFGLFFGPMHNVLPFLLLGIGIDDMFVIVQCWNTLTEEERRMGLPDRFGRTMQHAGVAITITSVTDVIAFAIGGTTVLPALRSFCLYASVGIVATYWFQCTFFVAWMSLDQRRIESKRDGCCPCFKHGQQWRPNRLSQKTILQSVFKGYAKLLMSWPVRLLVLAVTATLVGVGVWGNTLLRQEFDFEWFLPQGTYISDWIQKQKLYFPFGGDKVAVYFHGVDLADNLEEIDRLVRTLQNQTDIVDQVDAWTPKFIQYVNTHYYANSAVKLPEHRLNRSDFDYKLAQFLFSPNGGKFRLKFQFDEPLKCGQPAAKVHLSEVNFVHKIFSGPEEHIPAMNRIKAILSEANLTSSGRGVFPMSQFYPMWETDEVIASELYRNLGLALICVFLTTLFLISSLTSSLMVLLCVVLSLCNVGGFMHFWGLTIDTVSCNNLIIAIGLCVDYSAHVAHRFMVEEGTRSERVRKTLENIGPAVFNGGLSTLLAFVLLARSKSHVFMSFFKVFFLVVTFGLFHGLVFLPVILSLFGPKTMTSIVVSVSQSMQEEEEEEEQEHEGTELKSSSIPNSHHHPKEESCANGEVLAKSEH